MFELRLPHLRAAVAASPSIDTRRPQHHVERHQGGSRSEWHVSGRGPRQHDGHGESTGRVELSSPRGTRSDYLLAHGRWVLQHMPSLAEARHARPTTGTTFWCCGDADGDKRDTGATRRLGRVPDGCRSGIVLNRPALVRCADLFWRGLATS